MPSRRRPTLDHPAWESISLRDPARVAALRVAAFAGTDHGDYLGKIISDPADVTVDVESGTKTLVGRYATGKIDMKDIEAMAGGTGATDLGSLNDVTKSEDKVTTLGKSK